MSDKSNREYFAARAMQAQAMADAAKIHHVAAIHRTMAALYKELASLEDDESPPLNVIPN